MNLRIARKILKAVGTPDERRYNSFQIMKARVRWEKTKESRGLERFWQTVVCPALRAEAFRPLTDEEIERALDEAQAEPLSEEQIERMLAKTRAMIEAGRS